MENPLGVWYRVGPSACLISWSTEINTGRWWLLRVAKLGGMSQGRLEGSAFWSDLREESQVQLTKRKKRKPRQWRNSLREGIEEKVRDPLVSRNWEKISLIRRRLRWEEWTFRPQRVLGVMRWLGSSFGKTRNSDCAFNKGWSHGYFRNMMLPVIEKFSFQVFCLLFLSVKIFENSYPTREYLFTYKYCICFNNSWLLGSVSFSHSGYLYLLNLVFFSWLTKQLVFLYPLFQLILLFSPFFPIT